MTRDMQHVRGGRHGGIARTKLRRMAGSAPFVTHSLTGGLSARPFLSARVLARQVCISLAT